MATPLREVLVPAVAETGAVEELELGWIRRLSLDVVIPGGALVLIAAACFLGPLVLPIPKPVGGDILSANRPPFSPGHPLGTNPVGNDILSQLLYGGRVSFEVGLGTNLIGLVVGGLLGTTAAYRGGLVDAVIMRVLDVLIAFPSLVLALAIAEGLGPGELNVIWALSFFTVPAFARIARAATLRLREQTFILAARLAGTRGWRMLLRHIAPNVLPQLVTFGLLGVGVAIILEGALSFLGLGVQPPNPSWGNMIALGQQTLSVQPHLVLLPSICVFVTVLALNLIGDALRVRWAV